MKLSSLNSVMTFHLYQNLKTLNILTIYYYINLNSFKTLIISHHHAFHFLFLIFSLTKLIYVKNISYTVLDKLFL